MKSMIIILLLILISFPFVFAELQLVCLDEGGILEFSLCNPSIPDRECESSSGCQFCVDETSPGVFCPQHINRCNDEGFSCTYLNEEPGTIPDNPPENPPEEPPDNTNNPDNPEDEDDEGNKDDGNEDGNNNNGNSGITISNNPGPITGGSLGLNLLVGNVSEKKNSKLIFLIVPLFLEIVLLIGLWRYGRGLKK